jgi:hypothetical protein
MWQLLSACVNERGNKYKKHIILIKFFLSIMKILRVKKEKLPLE